MERRAVTVRGIVQGVGFRPFIYQLAAEHSLTGFVKNRAGSVLIEIEGEQRSLDQFLNALARRAPSLSRIHELAWSPRPVQRDSTFRIAPSDDEQAADVFISPDTCVCDDCLAEMLNPTDRRFGYPFLNCTNCGPRLTIVRRAPYDRANTTMAGFAMCPDCQAEYDDPRDRRFHAQPTACAVCGPRLEVCNAQGEPIERERPLDAFVAALLRGQIGALKGLGGYHLACDARDQHVVSELQRRKHREERPFAIMVRDLEVARGYCHVTVDEEKLLDSRRRPIVLLRRRAALEVEAVNAVCEAVAPGNPWLGVVLPYTPLHYLLMEAMGDVPLVMTSGNRSDEPIAYLDDEAFEQLGNIADIILRHDRPINVRCDDSVTRVVAGIEQPIRRSRGYAPEPIGLPQSCPRPLLAVGGQQKNVFALGSGRQAYLSQHMGDLDHFEAYRQFERDIGLYQQLFRVTPEVIVHDLHPDYASTQYAVRRAKDEGLPTLAVQHHHAHMAACMAEHGLAGPVIGVTFDGTGYGIDELTGQPTIWGGEFLVGDYGEFRRAAHLRNVPMPGGEKAVHEPWRMAASHLLDANCGLDLLQRRVGAAAIRTVEQIVARGFNSPLTSSAGRLFDAVASITGLHDRVSYEGQAAIEWEWQATDVAADGTYPFDLPAEASPAAQPIVVNTRPLIRALADDVRAEVATRLIARRFHSTLVELIDATCRLIRKQTGLAVVVLSGGVFMNALLAAEVCERLTESGFRVFRHQRVPTNDGGLCLGQLAVAAARLRQDSRQGQPAQRIPILAISQDDTQPQESTACA